MIVPIAVLADLRATVGRHTSLAIGYYSTAVQLVDTLLAREKQAQGDQDQGGKPQKNPHNQEKDPDAP